MLEISEFNAADYLEDAEDVTAFLNAAYEQGGTAGLSRALATVARSQGMTEVADRAGVNRVTLYKALGEQGHPYFDTVARILAACGVRMRFEPISSGDLVTA